MDYVANPPKELAPSQFDKLSVLTPMSSIELLHNHFREMFLRE